MQLVLILWNACTRTDGMGTVQDVLLLKILYKKNLIKRGMIEARQILCAPWY